MESVLTANRSAESLERYSDFEADIRETIGDLAFQALSQSGCGLIITDNEGKILYVNAKLCDITGYTPAELLGKNPKIFQSGSTKKDTYLSLWNAVSAGRPWRGVLQNKKKNGEFYWESITISPITGPTGEITHFSAIIEDITAEKMFESLQEQLEEESYQLQKHASLTALSMGIAHDLNNVLTCVLTGCEFLLQSQNDPARIADLANIMQGAGKKGAAIVNRLLEFSHHALPSSASLELREFTKHHLHYYDELLGPEMLLSWEPERQSCFTIGNGRLIHEALMQLLTNAKEASSPQACISICSGRVPSIPATSGELLLNCGLAKGPAVYIEVVDDGEGMDGETLRKAFDPFFTTKSGHRGLGLASVYGIMKGHSGTIAVKSSRDFGTSIKLYFPEIQKVTAGVDV